MLSERAIPVLRLFCDTTQAVIVTVRILETTRERLEAALFDWQAEPTALKEQAIIKEFGVDMNTPDGQIDRLY